ncbi:MAG: hypothetical protein JXJ04_23170, partial [Spirochaetales bacterium]|nr:hypothetical protein [Spirochaetales bacterium]
IRCGTKVKNKNPRTGKLYRLCDHHRNTIDRKENGSNDESPVTTTVKPESTKKTAAKKTSPKKTAEKKTSPKKTAAKSTTKKKPSAKAAASKK